ncbi:uncharacterized protein N7529_002826 [Penicillium soppii]|uniref:uncharacterized protein n=1 Tax=Penicillium soppii TaxID=69789 RepID=UPI002548AD40|nr:uncharacterized protein N7529_002826 [Penicillium soppii]KAJ5874396.1 hypothetical protein N7529_002826 [Penicillium soppii]
MAEALINRHPLQRLPSPSRTFSALVHFPVSGTDGLASSWLDFQASYGLSNSMKPLVSLPKQVANMPAACMTTPTRPYGWHFQYLTVIGLSLSTLTFFVALLADITLSRRLFLLKNILSICSAPLEVLISILYWGLRLIDERLVVPEWVVIPLHADISLHATPSVVMLIDLLLLSPPWTISIIPALAVSGTIAFGYWFWIEQCFAINGWYPYPIFEALPTEGRIGLFTLSATVMALSTITLKWLFGRVNGFGSPIQPQSRPGDIKRKEGL